ncbi:hypothetical protein ACHAXR_012906, partial [Thalassiosira sp. AJA248-18]
MDFDLYIGMGLALLGSNLCLLLVTLNVLDWVNFLHADLTSIEKFASSTTLSQWQFHFQSAAVGWMVLILLLSVMPSSSFAGVVVDKTKKRDDRIVLGIMSTLALPHILVLYRQYHPIIRRSLVGTIRSSNSKQPNIVSDDVDKGATGADPQAAPPVAIQQELVFTVDKMTCGGCGSHVRNLVEKRLAVQ